MTETCLQVSGRGIDRHRHHADYWHQDQIEAWYCTQRMGSMHACIEYRDVCHCTTDRDNAEYLIRQCTADVDIPEGAKSGISLAQCGNLFDWRGERSTSQSPTLSFSFFDSFYCNLSSSKQHLQFRCDRKPASDSPETIRRRYCSRPPSRRVAPSSQSHLCETLPLLAASRTTGLQRITFY